jgi:hypothetical protein
MPSQRTSDFTPQSAHALPAGVGHHGLVRADSDALRPGRVVPAQTHTRLGGRLDGEGGLVGRHLPAGAGAGDGDTGRGNDLSPAVRAGEDNPRGVGTKRERGAAARGARLGPASAGHPHRNPVSDGQRRGARTDPCDDHLSSGHGRADRSGAASCTTSDEPSSAPVRRIWTSEARRSAVCRAHEHPIVAEADRGDRLNLHNRAHAVAYALRHGLI